MSDQQNRQQFVREVTQLHRPLYLYVYAMVPTHEAADDILQETNLKLWDKVDRGESIRNFSALAYELARYEVLTWRKRQQREKLRFGDALVEQLALEAASRDTTDDSHGTWLRDCLRQLPPHSREIIQQRYASGTSVGGMAKTLGRSQAAISQALYRIRNTLAECIRARQSAEDER